MNEPPSPYPAAGEIVDGKYRIEKMLGEGGMGAVARATHAVLGGTVALKFMNPQYVTFPGAVERFINEGRASKAIKSDHVLPVSDVGLLPNGTPYLVMECLYGLDLADLLARDGPNGLPVQRAVHFVVQILRGLQAAHAINIIHRDMKPSNCFVITNDGEEDFVKILDFGISKVVQPGSSSLTQTNSALGTPLYMSPEQARSPRDVDGRSDIYSVGVIAYELLCGRTPFFSESGEFTEILFQLFTADVPPIRQFRSDLDPALAATVHKALVRETASRYPTAMAFAEALEPFASDKTRALIDRMRGFKPPVHASIPPMEGLPGSMVALSQLQRQGTDMMVNRPATDVQAGPPATEVIAFADTPRAAAARAKTELLQNPAKAGPGQHTAALPELRARPEGALDRTQFEPDAKRYSTRPPPADTAPNRPSTDLGASRDAAAEPAPPRRSPAVFVLPLLVVLAVGGGGVALTRGKADAGTKVAPTTTSPPPSAVVVPPPAVSSAAPAASSAAVAASSSASSAASAAVSAPTPKATPHTPPPTPKTGYIPGLDNGIVQ